MRKIEFVKHILDDCKLFKFKNFKDKRGSFSEIINFSEPLIKKLSFKCKQINLVKSKEYVFRGFHYQIKKPQSKIIYCLEGNIIDIVIDVRKTSKNFMKFFKIKLSDKNNSFLYIPNGFAHGYYSLNKKSKVLYLCNNFYDKHLERKIHYKDDKLKFSLPKKYKYKISFKDNEF